MRHHPNGMNSLKWDEFANEIPFGKIVLTFHKSQNCRPKIIIIKKRKKTTRTNTKSQTFMVIWQFETVAIYIEFKMEGIR